MSAVEAYEQYQQLRSPELQQQFDFYMQEEETEESSTAPVAQQEPVAPSEPFIRFPSTPSFNLTATAA